MTAIDSTHNYSSRVVALQLLRGKSDNGSSGDGKSDDSTFITSEAARAGKAASGPLQPKRQQREVLAFLSFTGFKASSDDVAQGLRKVFSDPDLQAEFNDMVKEEMRKAKEETHVMIAPDQARHFALRDVIMAHREMFPPEAFSFSTTFDDYGRTGMESEEIPSASDMAAKIFEGQVADKQADYDAAVAAKAAKPNPDGAKLDAMQQAVSTLTMNGPAPVDQGITDAKSAYAVLTQKLYPDDTNGASGSVGHQTEPAKDTLIGTPKSA
ncbi:hypothetical protein [Hyphomicrobium sp. 2TAF46]|uniref:hypothetical protein n=1 Tax=Hyphomicrobium sp. 2TAF46 TaxID=3233019 RepID=UPI003F916D7A